MSYTTHDTPAIVSRIESDLADVVATVRAGDPALRSLVLTGGFARGEGTVLNNVPQNDYDFVAIRGLGRPRESYMSMRDKLQRRLGLHIDLAPVPAWRLGWSAPSLFWYETARRGRVLWGETLLARIPTRTSADLEATEGLRLLVNRAAGLLLATEAHDAHAVRIQAAKAILAAGDAHMLARGVFAPSQTERWRLYQALIASGRASPELRLLAPWLAWAYQFKVDPASASERHAEQAWRAARRAVLDAIPAALHHAGLASLAAYGRRDGMIDRAVYGWRVGQVQGASRWVVNPTGRVRVATLQLLEATHERRVNRDDARRCLSGIAKVGAHPLRTLERLRAATLQ